MPITPPPHKRSSLALRLSPLLLIAAALVALAVFFVNYNTPPASADHGRDTEIWSATLTVQSTQAGPGCSTAESAVATKCSTVSTLTDDDFTYLGVDYTVEQISYASNALTFSLAELDIPAAFNDLTLYVNNVPTPRGSVSIVTGFGVVTFTSSSVPALSVGDTVQLKLVREYWTGVDLYGGGMTHDADGYQDLVITSESGSNTFMVRLDQAPTANVTITLQKNFTQCSACGKTYHGDVNAATVSPTTLTFTTSDWNTGQEVTVTGVADSDTVHEHLGIWANVSIASGAAATDPYRNPDRVNGVWVTIHDGSDNGSNHGGL